MDQYIGPHGTLGFFQSRPGLPSGWYCCRGDAMIGSSNPHRSSKGRVQMAVGFYGGGWGVLTGWQGIRKCISTS